MGFQVDLLGEGAFEAGWGRLEHRNGVAFRWMVGPRSVLRVVSSTPWSRLRVHCRFADAVRQDVSIRVAAEDGESSVAEGAIVWPGSGLHHRTIALDGLVPAGPARVELEPIHTWREPDGGRRLSVAFAALAGVPARRSARGVLASLAPGSW
jgi:hypothetical protein